MNPLIRRQVYFTTTFRELTSCRTSQHSHSHFGKEIAIAIVAYVVADVESARRARCIPFSISQWLVVGGGSRDRNCIHIEKRRQVELKSLFDSAPRTNQQLIRKQRVPYKAKMRPTYGAVALTLPAPQREHYGITPFSSPTLQERNSP
jgi:hypothetical protein